jgi:CBS domain-containing protein
VKATGGLAMLLTDRIRSVLDRKGWGVYSIAPEVSVYEAVSQMADKDIGSLAVISGDNLVGIFSERDYARKIILLGRSSKTTTIGEVMSYPASTVIPEDTVENCLRMMTTYRWRHLVVVNEGRAVGMVSIGDLVNWIMSAQEDMIVQLHSYISGNYPG